MTQAITDPKQASAALAELFGTHKRVVFFGGAGVSTASGIPDFRSVDGGSVEKVGVRALAAPVSDIRNQLIS